ncbi:hypothetical protein FRC00_005224 [Tulasnella sp. 408]|nr:hypothetical protein FRC00_005224 [Tulasnella sp. 408]
MEQKSQTLELVDSHEPHSWTLSLQTLLWKLRAATTSKREETPSKIALLPHDVLLAIIELLDERSVACLLPTCRVLRDVAEPIVYRHIRVPGNGERPHLLHRTLAGRPDLLPGVLSYHGPLIPVVNPSDASERSTARWFKMKGTTRYSTPKSDLSFDKCIERAKIMFSGAINIQELHLTDVNSKDTAQVLGALDQSKMMNIKKLVLNVEQCSPTLVAILRTMPGLKHLDLLGLRGGDIQLNETDLPELESLKANLQHAARIVPGRPIKKLELVHDWTPDHDQLWQRLTLSTCDITELTTEVPESGWRWAGGNVGEPEDLQGVARHLPRIERLCLHTSRPLSGSVVSFFISFCYIPVWEV